MNAEKSPENHNVDHEEIAKFEAVASRWWDLEGEFKPLHRINPLRLGYIAERAGGLLAKRCSMSVVAAAFWPRVWRAKARR
ncbi:3-demethylubiquinone-9 3-methyltransferase [Escherichia coli]|nr:3-demethylubiquinone-9 3-methyltransferase [Escherichia coli]